MCLASYSLCRYINFTLELIFIFVLNSKSWPAGGHSTLSTSCDIYIYVSHDVLAGGHNVANCSADTDQV
jgi:hypothetical protein